MQEEKYKYGFTTDVESEKLPPGLNEETITAIKLLEVSMEGSVG